MAYFCEKHIQEISRTQALLLPACVDDYVGPDNVVRFIEAFVESLDLAAAGFDRALPKATGTRDICVTRIFALGRRSAQAGNRGVVLGGAFVAMGNWAVCLSQIRSDRPDEGAPLGRARGAILRHMADSLGEEADIKEAVIPVTVDTCRKLEAELRQLRRN